MIWNNGKKKKEQNEIEKSCGFKALKKLGFHAINGGELKDDLESL